MPGAPAVLRLVDRATNFGESESPRAVGRLRPRRLLVGPEPAPAHTRPPRRTRSRIGPSGWGFVQFAAFHHDVSDAAIDKSTTGIKLASQCRSILVCRWCEVVRHVRPKRVDFMRTTQPRARAHVHVTIAQASKSCRSRIGQTHSSRRGVSERATMGAVLVRHAAGMPVGVYTRAHADGLSDWECSHSGCVCVFIEWGEWAGGKWREVEAVRQQGSKEVARKGGRVGGDGDG